MSVWKERFSSITNTTWAAFGGFAAKALALDTSAIARETVINNHGRMDTLLMGEMSGIETWILLVQDLKSVVPAAGLPAVYGPEQAHGFQETRALDATRVHHSP